MQPAIPAAKASLRAQVRDALLQLSAAEREAQSRQAVLLLKQQALYQKAQSILFFAPLADEPDLWPLVIEAQQTGKTIALPRFTPETGLYAACQVRELSTDIQSGRFGIREPAAHCAKLQVNRLDLILVPGVAFDLLGSRLGRGQGFYDQLLAVVHGTTCGVAFDVQMVREIPVATHDARVNCILTPTRWIEL
jgi:5-formyltetrahydrofolate cyclo-ligase